MTPNERANHLLIAPLQNLSTWLQAPYQGGSFDNFIVKFGSELTKEGFDMCRVVSVERDNHDSKM